MRIMHAFWRYLSNMLMNDQEASKIQRKIEENDQKNSKIQRKIEELDLDDAQQALLLLKMKETLASMNDATPVEDQSYFSRFFKDTDPRKAGFKRLGFGAALAGISALSIFFFAAIFDRQSNSFLMAFNLIFNLFFFSIAVSVWGVASIVSGRRWDQFKRWQQVILLLIFTPILIFLFGAINLLLHALPNIIANNFLLFTLLVAIMPVAGMIIFVVTLVTAALILLVAKLAKKLGTIGRHS